MDDEQEVPEVTPESEKRPAGPQRPAIYRGRNTTNRFKRPTAAEHHAQIMKRPAEHLHLAKPGLLPHKA